MKISEFENTGTALTRASKYIAEIKELISCFPQMIYCVVLKQLVHKTHDD